MPVTAGALITSVCINGSVGLACFSLFAVLRQWKFTAKLYKPKRWGGVLYNRNSKILEVHPGMQKAAQQQQQRWQQEHWQQQRQRQKG